MYRKNLSIKALVFNSDTNMVPQYSARKTESALIETHKVVCRVFYTLRLKTRLFVVCATLQLPQHSSG